MHFYVRDMFERLPPVAATSWNLSAASWKMGSAFSELMASSMAAVHLSHPSVCRSRCLSGSMPAQSIQLS